MQIKEARRLGNTYVAIDDIVSITVGYTHNEVYQKLNSKRAIVGRVHAFYNDNLSLDTSERYKSDGVTIQYTDITGIEIIKPEAANA